MQRIILSLALITLTGGVFLGGTVAFFNDEERSQGNVFTAGAIDLKVDNESYYNGRFNENTSWEAKDLTVEKFFDFDDVKPGDYGEDTISLHVETNNAWMCADVTLTSNDDNSQTEPESHEDANGTTTGELAGLVNFMWWADDGDNVLEDDEEVISQGPIGALGVGGSTTIALADSETNIWTEAGDPIDGEATYYIGKAWCFGTLNPQPIPQDNATSTMSPAADNNDDDIDGTPEDGGFTCDGIGLGNESQTDSLTADVSFSVVQARHNETFVCDPARPTAELVVTKIVVNDNGGNNLVEDFALYADDGIVAVPVVSSVTTTVPAGTYSITETGVPGYVASFSGDCNEFGDVTVSVGETKHCYITNDDLPANITLFKIVTGTQPLALPTQFGLRLDGTPIQHNSSRAVTSNAPHTINEVGRIGYSFVSITGVSSYGKSCPGVLGGSITLDEGETVVCTITNQKKPI
jgi:predicted ribosomally synthesized peptide with SipW-like signal peptide